MPYLQCKIEEKIKAWNINWNTFDYYSCGHNDHSTKLTISENYLNECCEIEMKLLKLYLKIQWDVSTS